MDSLKSKGYCNAVNRMKGLDKNHIILAIKWLAKFHALGYAFIDQQESGIKNMTDENDIFFWKWCDTPNDEHVFKKRCEQLYGWNNEKQLKTLKNIDELVLENSLSLDNSEKKLLYFWKKFY